jgi:hypothetical protein
MWLQIDGDAKTRPDKAGVFVALAPNRAGSHTMILHEMKAGRIRGLWAALVAEAKTQPLVVVELGNVRTLIGTDGTPHPLNEGGNPC